MLIGAIEDICLSLLLAKGADTPPNPIDFEKSVINDPSLNFLKFFESSY